MGYRIIHSTQSNAQRPIRALARMEFRVPARLENDFGEYASKEFFRGCGSEKAVPLLARFLDFVLAILQIAALLFLRFWLLLVEYGFGVRRGFVRATFELSHGRLQGLANSGFWLARSLHRDLVSRTKESVRYATSTHISGSRIFDGFPRWGSSTAGTVLMGSWPWLYPQNSNKATASEGEVLCPVL